MSSREVTHGAIVVVDEIVDAEAVIDELPADLASSVRRERCLPSGRGVVALLAGPGTEVTEAVLGRLPDLRVVVVTSTGWDHVDTEAATSCGVRVVGVDSYCVDEVAEHTIALILDLMRGVTWLDAEVRTGGWDHAGLGRTVKGAKLGLVGCGRIGSAVAWRAAALGMEVSAFDPALERRDSAEDTSQAGAVLAALSLDALVSSSDVVSLHVPLVRETRGLVDAALLARFRPGSFLVNVSRGEVVTERALGEALRAGRIAGAGLDVLVNEPPAPNAPVLTFPRTVITPHSAWYSRAAIDRVSRNAGHALARALRTDPGT